MALEQAQNMKRFFPVIDADGHVLERDRELREFLPAEFRAVPGKREYPLFSWDGWPRGALSPHKREHPSVELWQRFLDATDIALTVLYPNEGLNIGLQRDGDWAVALARAYNDWLHHDFLSVNPRFHGVALLAVQEPAPVYAADRLRPLGLMPVPQALDTIQDDAGRVKQLRHEGRELHLLSGPERIESGWWDGRDIARDYYIDRTTDGAHWWVFREGVSRRWFLHGCFV